MTIFVLKTIVSTSSVMFALMMSTLFKCTNTLAASASPGAILHSNPNASMTSHVRFHHHSIVSFSLTFLFLFLFSFGLEDSSRTNSDKSGDGMRRAQREKACPESGILVYEAVHGIIKPYLCVDTYTRSLSPSWISVKAVNDNEVHPCMSTGCSPASDHEKDR